MVNPATLARSALSLGPSLLLPLLLPLSPRCAHAYEPGTGSFATGNLNLTAPYGIRPSEFRAVTARLTSSATFNITGYDVSADPGASANANANAEIAGWTLTVGVTTDVSLIDAANSSNLDFEATTLYMAPPGGSGGNMTLLPAWRVCAVVYPGLAAGGQEAANSSSSASVEVDGTCDGVLSGGCIQAIQSGTAGIDSNGTCGEYVLPSACADEFPEASVNSTAFGEFFFFFGPAHYCSCFTCASTAQHQRLPSPSAPIAGSDVIKRRRRGRGGQFPATSRCVSLLNCIRHVT